MKKYKIMAMVAMVSAFSLFAPGAFAEGEALPSIGVDVSAWITVALTALGAVIATVVGAIFAVMLVKKGLKWARRIG